MNDSTISTSDRKSPGPALESLTKRLENDVFRGGYQAYWLGLSLAANPRGSKDHEKWAEGWQAAHTEKKGNG